ncbi:hypothetical protein ACFLXI_08355 [Chloroflexota bacterium]
MFRVKTFSAQLTCEKKVFWGNDMLFFNEWVSREGALAWNGLIANPTLLRSPGKAT